MAEYAKRQAGSGQSQADQHSNSSHGDLPPRKQEPKDADDQSIASMVAHHAKTLVQEQVAQRAGKPAADLGKLAKALHLTSEQLEGNLASPYVGKAAAQLERFSDFLDSASGADAMRSIEQFARKKPLLFIGGAALLGFGGARFLKSTATGRASDSETTTQNKRRSPSTNSGRHT